MSTLPTGTITFFFTDLEGSTSLWANQREAMGADLARHDALLRAAIVAHEGYVFAPGGDGFCAAFHTAQDALNAALVVQRSLGAEEWAVGGPGLKARLALHTGEAQERDGNYHGPTLNRAARLLSIAHGGQTVLSQATEQMVRDALPAGASLRDLGPHRLKDLLRPEQVFQFLHPDLPGDFPPLRSLEQFPHNLPQRLDSFVGREDALAQIGGLLDGHAHLVTLTGAGGAGKTRLAQQAAAEALERFPDGVWFVGLEALADPALVPQAVAAAACIREQPGRPLLSTLCEDLRAKRTLLLLDNCEHLIGACAALSHAVLQACPHVQILAISRKHLGIGGESCCPVKPLPLTSPRPDEPSDAVRLFVERATLKHPSFALTAQNAPAVARICRRLDGIPLAIELAAPRVRMLTPEQIAQRLDKDFRLLTGGARTALPRQQTMRETIRWSHDLLSEAECLLFRRLSVFAGGWTLEAAERVCSGDGLDEADVFDLLSALDDHSLVQAEDDGHGECRYRMLETLRDYSLEQLGPSPDAAGAYARHTDYFLALAEQAEPELRGPQQNDWLDRLEAEHDNFRAILDRTTDSDTRLRLASALQRFWLARGYLGEGRRWLAQAQTESESVALPVQAKLLTACGIMAWAQADYAVARSFHEQALAFYETLNDCEGIAKTWMNLGIMGDFQEDYAYARQNYEDSLTLYRKLGDKKQVAFVLLNLGAHLTQQNDLDAAVPYIEECLAIRRSLSDKAGIALALYCYGQIAYKRGDWPQASVHLRESLALRRELSDQRGQSYSLLLLACTLQAMGHDRSALTLLAAAEQMRDLLSVPLQSTDRTEHERALAALAEKLGSDECQRLWQQEKQGAIGNAIALALENAY